VTYTLTGNPASTTDANGNMTSYTYDVLDRLTNVADPMGRVTTYAYDALSRRTAVFSQAVQTTPLLQQGYTPNGLLARVVAADHLCRSVRDRWEHHPSL
jgi:YD repeat-containing protein